MSTATVSIEADIAAAMAWLDVWANAFINATGITYPDRGTPEHGPTSRRLLDWIFERDPVGVYCHLPALLEQSARDSAAETVDQVTQWLATETSEDDR